MSSSPREMALNGEPEGSIAPTLSIHDPAPLLAQTLEPTTVMLTKELSPAPLWSAQTDAVWSCMFPNARELFQPSKQTLPDGITFFCTRALYCSHSWERSRLSMASSLPPHSLTDVRLASWAVVASCMDDTGHCVDESLCPLSAACLLR